jgi:hypothetical protein
MIERAYLGGPLSDSDAAIKFRNAPAWFLEPINRDRRQRGVAAIPIRNTASAPPRRKPAAVRAALAPVVPRSTLPKAPVKLPKVAFVLAHGTGEPGGGTDIEIFLDGAFAAWTARVQREGRAANFEIRMGGHETTAIANAGDGLEFRDVGVVGPVVIWQPDGGNARHRAAVALIRAGADKCSVEFHALSARLIDGVRVVSEACPVGVALLRPNQEPAFRGAMAAVLPGVEPIERELIRVAGRSLKRTWGTA